MTKIYHLVLLKFAPDKLHRVAPLFADLEGLRKQIPQGRARATLPALWFNNMLALIPALPHGAYSAVAEAAPVARWPPIPARAHRWSWRG